MTTEEEVLTSQCQIDGKNLEEIIDEAVINLCQELRSHGKQCFLVGGATRDLLMGQKPKDWDLTTDATPDEMMKIFKDDRVIPSGIQHGTITVLKDGEPYEITTFSYEFAEVNNYSLVLADHQNYYPDLSFILKNDNNIKFAVDLKTTYRIPEYPKFCNKFTLGSHGTYFIDRNSTKNIQFPYKDYVGHYCLGIIYSRALLDKDEEFQKYSISELESINSAINYLIFFACEKWTIASDKQGSGNTANIGSIEFINDIINGNGVFKNLGEEVFDEYWKNYGRMIVTDSKGNSKKLTSLNDFLRHTGRDIGKINPQRTRKKSDRE